MPFHEMECTFKVGRMSQESLKHPVLYNLLDSEDNEVHRVGLVLDKSVNKQMNKYLAKNSKTGSNPDARLVSNWANNASSVKIQLSTKPKKYRVKIFEVEVGNEGIFALGERYDDENTPADRNDMAATVNTLVELLLLLESKQARERRGTLFSRHIQMGKEVESHLRQDGEELDLDRVDEWLYGIVSESGMLQLSLAVEQPTGWSQ